MESSLESAIPCHRFEPGVLAGKLCVWDAQMRNAVYVPTPHVMGFSQASWLVSCASRTHRWPTLSTFPRHIIFSYTVSRCPSLSIFPPHILTCHTVPSNVRDHVAWEHQHPCTFVRPGRTTCQPRRLNTIHDTLCHSPLTVDNDNDSQPCRIVGAHQVLVYCSLHILLPII